MNTFLFPRSHSQRGTPKTAGSVRDFVTGNHQPDVALPPGTHDDDLLFDLEHEERSGTPKARVDNLPIGAEDDVQGLESFTDKLRFDLDYDSEGRGTDDTKNDDDHDKDLGATSLLISQETTSVRDLFKSSPYRHSGEEGACVDDLHRDHNKGPSGALRELTVTGLGAGEGREGETTLHHPHLQNKVEDEIGHSSGSLTHGSHSFDIEDSDEGRREPFSHADHDLSRSRVEEGDNKRPVYATLRVLSGCA